MKAWAERSVKFTSRVVREQLSMSTGVSYNDQGGAEAAVEAGQESTPTSASTGTAFGLFSADFKK